MGGRPATEGRPPDKGTAAVMRHRYRKAAAFIGGGNTVIGAGTTADAGYDELQAMVEVLFMVRGGNMGERGEQVRPQVGHRVSPSVWSAGSEPS
ncbi:hypothetical protein I0C86_14950 [Plantactinospora sp. S1510]|uniref:Uncharacterized protein n=1 Tax=Plantactinospora alkalitolerans TaxID=2789879 RepID=A0ABS0GVL2_9ACTN|nr:hypothetical protein [Plantactinospora alkalitolerans]MBF9130243.1 hypothetical protein [Plantactinospora alkalitolerans]